MTSTNSALTRVITFANGKGGVGKTSCSTNVAGIAAASGWRVLVIGLDPQGNEGHDLGFRWEGKGDDGDTLMTALTQGTPLTPVLTDVRPGLDVISGGAVLDDLEDVLSGRSRRGGDTRTALADALVPLAPNYDLIVIDTPPIRPTLSQLALAATRWVVVPTKSDRSSIRGLGEFAPQLVRAREVNPDLELLGALLFATATAATTVRKHAIQDIEDTLGGAAQMFSTVIRHSEATAADAREKGMLVHELVAHGEQAEPWWKALREGRVPPRVPTSPGLAQDYASLTQEILARMVAQEQGQEAIHA